MGVWKKGQSGNPGGRPKELKEVIMLAREEGAASIRALVKVRDNPKAPPAARAFAANAILDRGYGKPTQAIQTNGNFLDRLSYEELCALEEAIEIIPGDAPAPTAGSSSAHH